MKNLLKIILAFTPLMIVAFFSVSTASAADCGGAIDCVCGDTVIASTTLSRNLNCDGGRSAALKIGADNVTIDGGGFSIIGDKKGNDCIQAMHNNNVTIKNFSSLSACKNGIMLDDVEGATIEDITISSSVIGINLGYVDTALIDDNTITTVDNQGMYIGTSTNVTISNNTVTENGNIGLKLNNSTSLNVNNNTVNDNGSKGIEIDKGSGVVQNNITNNNEEMGIYIDNSDGMTISGNQANNSIMDSGIYISNSDDGEINNNTCRSNLQHGLILASSNGNEIEGNTISANTFYGLSIFSGEDNIVDNNYLFGNFVSGFFIQGSTNNTLTNNKIEANATGIEFQNSSANTISNNHIFNNVNDIVNQNGTENNNYQANTLEHNINSVALEIDKGTEIIAVNQENNFTATLYDLNGDACNDCQYSFAFSPDQNIEISQENNEISGSFQLSRSGSYSLLSEIEDDNDNIVKRYFRYISGDTEETSVDYYYRGISPTHGQPAYSDSKSLLLSAATSSETWDCGIWIQNSPDELPEYPLASITGVNNGVWYKQGSLANAYMGIERYYTYSTEVEESVSVARALDYTWVENEFSGLNWMMDYSRNWLIPSIKLRGSNPSFATFPTGQSEQPSYLNLSYEYSKVPAIKSIDNDNLIILSATAENNDQSDAKISIENPLDSATSTTIVVENIYRPFQGVTSNISADGNSQFSFNLAAESSLTLQAIPLSISHASGSVAIVINSWGNLPNSTRTWTETSENHELSVDHSIGGLAANREYRLSVDGNVLRNYTSNNSGRISFTYAGGYSEKNFELSLVPEYSSGGGYTPPAGVGDGERDISGNLGEDSQSGLISELGVNVLTYISTKNYFSALTSKKGEVENHFFLINSLDINTQKLTLTFDQASEKVIPLNLEETKKYDLDNDGIDDIKFTFQNLNINRAEIGIYSLIKPKIIAPEISEGDNEDILEQARLDFTKINPEIIKRTIGNIVIQTESKGEAWYINPQDQNKYYLGRPSQAFTMMQKLSLGISNKNLENIPVGLLKNKLMQDSDQDQDGLSDRMEKGLFTKLDQKDSDNDSFSDYQEIENGYNPLGAGKINADKKLINSLLGKILLQTENNGEAWYLNPIDSKRYYLGRPEEAFAIMQSLSLGITNLDLNQIPLGALPK